MRKIRQINIKNRTYYFYNDQINLKDFDAKMLKINKKNYKKVDVYITLVMWLLKILLIL